MTGNGDACSWLYCTVLLMCKGAEITFSVLLRYYHRRLLQNNFHIKATTNATNFECRQPLTRHQQEEASIHDNKLLYPRSIRHQTMQALYFITTYLLSFSVCQISFCPSTCKNNPQNTLVTRWRLRIELVIGWKSEKSLLIYNSIAKNIWGFATSPKVLRYGNPLFPTISIAYVPNSDPDPLSRLYDAVKLWNLSQSIERSLFSLKSVPYW